MARDELWVGHLGTIPYAEALEIQSHVAGLRRRAEIPDTLLLLEHPPVYTRGRRSAAAELPRGEGFYRDRGIEILATDRGGRLTYHGPGQLVGYPIMATADIGGHLRGIEAAIAAALADEAIVARSRCEEGPDYTGVWVADRKIASIGIHLARGVTTHGFAVNVCNDLRPFSWVIACGLADVTMTSIAAERSRQAAPPSPTVGAWPAIEDDGRPIAAVAGGDELLTRFRHRVADCFGAVHDRRSRTVSPARLGLAPSEPPASTRDRTSRAAALTSPVQPRGCDPDEHTPQTVAPRSDRERAVPA